jgi:hypothetical protein
MPVYEVWVHHGEEVREDAMRDEDRMDAMLNAICPEFEADFEDPPSPEVQKFLSSLKLQKKQCMST